MSLVYHLIVAIAWAVVAQWPWGVSVIYAVGAQVVLHLLAPFWFHLANVRPFHRAFLYGPLVIALIDGAFLYYAWRNELWWDLTVVFVPLLGAGAVVTLLYGMLVMGMLAKWRANREARREAEGPAND